MSRQEYWSGLPFSSPEDLPYVEERLDIDNMFTHAAFEIILGNVDFTNVRIYRVPGGKWKYLLFDVEACWRNLDKTPIEYYIKPLNAKIQGFRHEPLNALLKVPEMKAKFLRRVSGLLGTVFRWDNVEKHFDDILAQVEPILPRHIARWKNMKLSNWQTNIKATKYYARVRPKEIPGMLKDAMKLTGGEMEEYFGETLRLLDTLSHHNRTLDNQCPKPQDDPLFNEKSEDRKLNDCFSNLGKKGE